MRNLSESAFDFLERSVEEIKTHPKYSVIHFATAAELILKARLMREHWTLVVERTSDVSVEDFLSGQAKTVTQGDAIKRLKNACGENIPQDAVNQFGKIAAHRNRMIHFFHEAGQKEADNALTEEIVKELCLSWFYLERLLSDWNDQFEVFEEEILSVTWRMKQLRAYLQVAFDRLKPEIEAAKISGTVFTTCSGCGFDAAAVNEISEVFFEKRCKVCGLGENYIEIPCPNDCGKILHIDAQNVSGMTCENCEHEVTSEELGEALDTEFSDPSDCEPQANCAQCTGYGSVVQHNETFVCTKCLYSEDSAPQCGWCNERQIGGSDLEFSYHTGCEFCEGHAG
ncbi:hypothetical protein Aam_169_004 [Acidocella aminolytica 101 = DSM 11237]|uniref:HsdR n=1 Tax=Acidocella aminolytica 101 = DSM 11237 TaxID=1120923 RepID=A0A0D6PLB2_9PROT|nr:hypothetical protein Aam_169_004 [Acidocella aminolytica 101 = DSM 11237]GBQ44971.1 hypothetical protein AA11237_3621 [Acidocella aminolytica 101 = DSM 11237]